MDVLLVTHFHLDHCASLPFFILKARRGIFEHTKRGVGGGISGRAAWIRAFIATLPRVRNPVRGFLHTHAHTQTYTRPRPRRQTAFKGRVFMTHATKAIYRIMLSDFVKARKRKKKAHGEPLFS